ncbi:beta-lactamase family protein [Fulvivirga maritima]|uniref:serine hydrolase domain-containing protein n=1 Tax=Fulvivirga maritima TaxID=2904247 RepID=UPI001F1B82F4|nr:serine hydrolase domain-containing protein [Fulvivirga maritima]UII26143.1 beta-lactamase family protein [Fulvivirga maritima]
MNKKQLQRLLRIILPVGTVISLFFVPWPLVWAWVLPLPPTIPDQLNEALDHGFDGIIVYVDQTGKEPEFYAAGWHNRAEKILARPDALFKMASIGKLYDAVSITKLVHEDLLDLDKTVADYFPDLADRIEYADKITLSMLVQHRSGIPNYTNTPDFWVNPPKSKEETLARILDLPANFEPNTDYEYCNTNYLLLTMLIEKVTGLSKFQYIKKSILTPLGLKNTYESIHQVELEEVMSGYYVGVEEDIKATDYGSMLATAEDVGTFLRALNDGTVFKDGEQEIYSSLYKYNHTGLIPGYQSIAEYHKGLDLVVVQFVNTTNFDGYTWNLSEIVYNRIVKIISKR